MIKINYMKLEKEEREIKMYRPINEKEIEKELKAFKKIILYDCNKECQDFCGYYEEKYCIRCIPFEKGYVQLQPKKWNN